MRKMRYLALPLVFAFLFSGCNLIRVNPERDGAQVVATVKDEAITKKQVYDAIGLTWTQKIETWEVADYNKKKDEKLEALIQESVQKQKYKELGYYNFTADEQKKIDDGVAAYKTSDYDKILADYQAKAKEDPTIKPEEMANADIEAYRQQQADKIAADKAYKAVTDPITPAEEDIKKLYDDTLSQQKTAFDQDAAQVYQYDGYAQAGLYPPTLYYPADGLFRVKHILIALPDDVQTAISDLRTAGKNADADQKRTEELKKIEAAANEALTKAQAVSGDLAKLDALMTELSKDTGMTADSPGYLMGKDSKQMVQEFTDAALKLTDTGKPSGLVATDYGYHILWITEKVSKGDVSLDKVKDKMTELAKSQKRQTAWNNTVSGWMDEYKIHITRYTSRLHD